MKIYVIATITFLIGLVSQSQVKSSQSQHYILTNFSQGSILFKDGTKQTGILNFNALSKNFALKKGNEIVGLSKKVRPIIDTVYVSNRKFIVKDNTFYEFLLKSTIELYVEYSCDLATATEGRSGYGSSSQTSSTTPLIAIENQGNLYALELPEIYKATLDIHYWLNKNDILTKLKTVNQLKRVYTKRKKEIKTYRKTNSVDFKNPLSMLKLVRYLESLDN